MCGGMEDASYQAEHNLSGSLEFHFGTALRKAFSECRSEERAQRG